MAGITGPIRSLPGHKHVCPADMICDECGVEKANIRIQGETDSFGCEMHDYCEMCYSEIQKSIEESKTMDPDFGKDVCDHCHKHTFCNPARDPEEGSTGAIYYLCVDCKKKMVDAFIDDSRHDDDDGDDACWDDDVW